MNIGALGFFRGHIGAVSEAVSIIFAGTVYESSSTAATHDLAYPSSLSSGDLICAVFASKANYFDDGLSITGGFTERVSIDGGPGDLDTYMWTKVSDGTETGTETVSNPHSIADHAVGFMIRVGSGEYESFDTAAETVNFGSGNSTTSPTATASSDDNLVIRLISHNAEGTSDIASTSSTEIAQASTTGHRVAAFYEYVENTSVPAETFSWTGTSNGSIATVVLDRTPTPKVAYKKVRKVIGYV